MPLTQVSHSWTLITSKFNVFSLRVQTSFSPLAIFPSATPQSHMLIIH